jgi:2-hydroxychromene-2-carboxylate isomerase
MTDKRIDYYFSPMSTWTYLGHRRLEAIAQKHDAAIAYKPVDMARVFAASGGLPLPQRPPQRRAYRRFELERWRTFLDLPINLQPKHAPVPVERASRMIIAAEEESGRLAFALMRACWVEERDISDPATLLAIAGECGLDGEALLARADAEEAAATFEANTAEAITRQVFGAPTYFFRDEPFWGQDRLDFLDRALGA